MADDSTFPRDPSEAEWEADVVEQLGDWWQHIDGVELAPRGRPDAARKFSGERWRWDDLILYRRLRDAIARINPQLPEEVVSEVVDEFAKRESADAFHERHRLHRLLTGDLKVTYEDPVSGQTRTETVWVIDFVDPYANELVAANQVTVKDGKHSRRLDVVAYVNGLPLAVFELKAAGAKEGSREAYDQLMTYRREFGAGALALPVFAVASDGITARLGTLFTPWEHMAPWDVDADGHPVNVSDGSALETMIAGVFDPAKFIDLLANFTSFSRERGGGVDTVRVAKAHQMFAVNKAIDKTVTAVASNGKIGVVWHTQGSGKSMEMVYYVAKAMKEPALRNPTFVVLTDRIDLDSQLYATFAASELTPERTLPRAETKEQIQQLLADRPSGGIVFTTLQKFWRTKEDRENNVYFPTLSTRRNIIVIVDEAHRSHYENIEGYARNLHDALPNAAFIAFTGTPISKVNANTRSVFGDYIDVYDLGRAVRDGATVRVFYENRHIPVHLPEGKEPIEFDEEADLLTSDLDPDEQAEVRRAFALYEDVVGAPERVTKLAGDIVTHWKARRADMFALTGNNGKGMIVCYSRKIAASLYQEITNLEPTWHSDNDAEGLIKVVYTGSAKDSALVGAHNRSKGEIQKIQRRATDDTDPLELVIVQSMWLTGFDSPPLHTLYLDKPMRGAALMQAIARVNRRWGEKPSGLVVDFLGIADNLTKALAEYTTATDAEPQKSIGETTEAAADMVIELCGILNDQLSGINWRATRDSGRKKAFLKAALDVVDYLKRPEPDPEDGKPTLAQRYADTARKLAQAYSNCSRSSRLRPLRPDIEFYNAVRQYQAKLRAEERAESGLASRADIELAIRQLTASAVAVDEVVDIYEAAGIQRPDLSHLDEDFLRSLRESQRPNLAVEALRRAIAREIRVVHPHNVVKQEGFTDKLLKTMERYRMAGLTAAEIIEALVRLAKEISADRGRAAELGLTEDELAFYDAVAQNDSAKQLLGDAVLADIAKALVQELQDLPRDWHIRDQAQALVRSKVKRLLAKFGYPPDAQQAAVDLVLRQTRTYIEDQDV
ncbi:type I restriction endonuclease subunit R [Micromonospora sp. CPCC 206061]|uniref:type I restriction endonuclease subunit R n=1 Tax=Micromonospora sp. CPCC 206061 TaxID=3122410 RepID=UPI002FF1A602